MFFPAKEGIGSIARQGVTESLSPHVRGRVYILYLRGHKTKPIIPKIT